MKRGFEHLNARSRHVSGEMRPSYAFFGKRDKHSCSASAIINLSMVSIVDSSLTTLHASANRILRCEANAYFIGSGYAGSLSFSFSGCRPRFWRLAALPLNARARALPLLNLTKKRDCSQSNQAEWRAWRAQATKKILTRRSSNLVHYLSPPAGNNQWSLFFLSVSCFFCWIYWGCRDCRVWIFR